MTEEKRNSQVEELRKLKVFQSKRFEVEIIDDAHDRFEEDLVILKLPIGYVMTVCCLGKTQTFIIQDVVCVEAMLTNR